MIRSTSSKWWGLLVLLGLALACEDPAHYPDPAPRDVETPPGDDSFPPLLEKRTSALVSFADPQKECASCHENHVREWEGSSHAYAAVDPVFHAMVRVGQNATSGKLGQFCVQCHSPTGLAMDQTPVFFEGSEGVWKQDFSGLDAVAQQGVSCDVCHSINEVIEPLNARLVMTPDGVRRGGLENPQHTSAHGSEYSELHASGEVCVSCHSVVNPAGALIEQTSKEFALSDAARGGETCQSCHMPSYQGRATPDSPERTLHRHRFVGVDVSLLPRDEFPGYDEYRALTAELLRGAADLRVGVENQGSRLEVEIENLAAHALPTGATAERQMWLEVEVRNPEGELVFVSGSLDDNGDLRDGAPEHTTQPGSDPQLIAFGQQLVRIPGAKLMSPDELQRRRAAIDESCLPMALGVVPSGLLAERVSFPWEATWQCDSMIAADATARGSYQLGRLGPGLHRVQVRLLFRTFPPYFLRKLEEQGGLDPAVKGRVPIVEMAKVALELSQP